MNIIELCLGDYSQDGHNQTASITFDVTGASASSLTHDHMKGCKILGETLESQCEEAEDRALSEGFAAKLKSYSVPFQPNEELTTEDFAELYMQIAKLANPELSWTVVKFEALQIGGYGLFYF